MEQYMINEANRLKQQAGQDLDAVLTLKFQELKAQGVIKDFWGKSNFNHTGFTYRNQYKTNYILETLDEKIIIINSSNSYRQDRVKQDLYDFQGIMGHAKISDRIIASILLYPDEQLTSNTALLLYRRNVQNKIAYSPATHILGFSELIHFLENHKISVELEKAREEEEGTTVVKDGSYYGVRGNTFEKEVVRILNDYEQLRFLKVNISFVDNLYKQIITTLASDCGCCIQDIISVEATNTVKKLAGGGNAKTDVIIKINTVKGVVVQTISIKNTIHSRVSCHDYKADDFIRVLNISDTKLANYFHYYQEFGSHKNFVNGLPSGYTADEFKILLEPHQRIFMEWVLMGAHDSYNLIEPESQISNYLLINKSGVTRFIDFQSYIRELFDNSHFVYGVPLSWTYPSKQCGSRIQLKLPILV